MTAPPDPSPYIRREKVKLRDPWWAEGWIYTSDIGAALHLRVKPGASARAEQDIKGALRRDLRLLGDLAAELGALCPVIGVVEVPDGQQGWGWLDSAAGEQDWHQGRFSLFRRKDEEEARACVEDLLSPTPALLGQETGKQKTWDQVLSELKILFNKAEERLALDLLQDLEAWTASRPRPAPATIGERVYSWAERAVSERATLAPAAATSAAPSDEDPEQLAQHQPPESLPIIHRVRKATVRDLRGFREEQTLDLDADLVLIVGANGRGKSSLMEALLLGLTGHHVHALRDLQVQDRKESPFAVSLDAITAEGEVVPLSAEGTGDGLTVRAQGHTWTETPSASQDVGPTWIAEPGQPPCPPGTDIHSELQYRASSYLQDYSDELFDGRARDKTLRDLLEPPPDEAKALAGELTRDNSNSAASKIWSKVVELTGRIRQLDVEEGEQRRATLRKDLSGDHLLSFERLYAEITADAGWPEAPVEPESWVKIAAEVASRAPAGRDMPAGLPDLQRRPLESLAPQMRYMAEAKLKQMRRGASERRGVLESEYTRLLAELEQTEARLRDLAPRVPLALQALSWLSPDAPADQPPQEGQLTMLFRLLRDNALEWSGRLPRARGEDGGVRHLPDIGATAIPRVIEELMRVDPARAATCLDQLESFERGHRAVLRDHEVTSRVFAQLEQRLAEIVADDPEVIRWQELLRTARDLVTRSKERLPPFRSWELYQEWLDGQSERSDLQLQLDAWTETLGALEAVARALADATEPSEALRDDLARETLRVLTRFALTDGMEALTLKHDTRQVIVGDSYKRTEERLYFRPMTADNRSIPHFSTGQRSQVAVAWMVAQRLVTANEPRIHFPHRLLLLDDVSTAYDLTNLVREAVLWRQLAYHPDPRQRLQVILSSHHDELTSRMLDLVVPPEGCSLRVLSFDGWDRITGPRVTPYQVEAGKTGRDLVVPLAKSWEETLC